MSIIYQITMKLFFRYSYWIEAYSAPSSWCCTYFTES